MSNKMTSWLPRGTLLEYPNPEYLWAVKKKHPRNWVDFVHPYTPNLIPFPFGRAKMCWKICASVLVLFPVFPFDQPSKRKHKRTNTQDSKTNSNLAQKYAKQRVKYYLSTLDANATPNQQRFRPPRQVAESLLCFFFRANTSWMGFLDMCQSRRLRAPTCVVCKLAAAAARNSRK